MVSSPGSAEFRNSSLRESSATSQASSSTDHRKYRTRRSNRNVTGVWLAWEHNRFPQWTAEDIRDWALDQVCLSPLLHWIKNFYNSATFRAELKQKIRQNKKGLEAEKVWDELQYKLAHEALRRQSLEDQGTPLDAVEYKPFREYQDRWIDAMMSIVANTIHVKEPNQYPDFQEVLTDFHFKCAFNVLRYAYEDLEQNGEQGVFGRALEAYHSSSALSSILSDGARTGEGLDCSTPQVEYRTPRLEQSPFGKHHRSDSSKQRSPSQFDRDILTPSEKLPHTPTPPPRSVGTSDRPSKPLRAPNKSRALSNIDSTTLFVDPEEIEQFSSSYQAQQGPQETRECTEPQFSGDMSGLFAQLQGTWNTLETKYRECMNKQAKPKIENDHFGEEKHALNARIGKLKQRLKETRRQMEEAEQANSTWIPESERRPTLELYEANLREMDRRYEVGMARAKKEHGELVGRLKAEKAELVTSKERLSEQLAEARHAHHKFKKRHDSGKKVHQQQTGLLRSLKAERTKLIEEIAEKCVEIDALQESGLIRERDLSQQRDKLRRANIKITKDKDAAIQVTSDLIQREKSLRDENEGLATQLGQAKHDLQVANSTRTNTDETTRRLQTEYDDIKSDFLQVAHDLEAAHTLYVQSSEYVEEASQIRRQGRARELEALNRARAFRNAIYTPGDSHTE